MRGASDDPQDLLQRALASDRIHSAYLISGPGDEPRSAALAFARGLVCQGEGARPCEACSECHRSTQREEIAIDGSGRRGPLLRHVGDHPDLFWVERGEADTRVRIGQVRALQHALHLRASGDTRRAAVIADAEWLNAESQNALLRLLEEPPPRTSLILVTASSAGLLATVRSRCQRLAFRPEAPDPLADPERAETVARLDAIGSASVPELLDWAEEFRGERARAAAGVQELLETASAHVRSRVVERARGSAPAEIDPAVRPGLDAFRALADCRKTLVQRNANPQMVAERALLALREAYSR